eukprot:CAMPEP_0167821618 /NCGR_PEP_ID=MMETSP0112_2-20121227/6914_1 /TAXON_ID=91324 /ORGANISM="Lotharella globosa, Strain CCCM811" /LENGTH=51 /DNA_ID=CAMNT_0007722641 /DNA_START=30 /DNA_END=181 /DNA_ORIENTATION=-
MTIGYMLDGNIGCGTPILAKVRVGFRVRVGDSVRGMGRGLTGDEHEVRVEG